MSHNDACSAVRRVNYDIAVQSPVRWPDAVWQSLHTALRTLWRRLRHLGFHKYLVFFAAQQMMLLMMLRWGLLLVPQR